MIVLFDKANSADIFYRCKFDSDIECLYVEFENSDERALYVPGFEFERAKTKCKTVEVKKLGSSGDLKMIFEDLERYGEKIKIHSSMPFGVANLIKNKEVVKEIFTGRQIKSEEEIKYIEEAQKAAKESIDFVESKLREAFEKGLNRFNVTSEYLQREARKFLIDKGYDCDEIIISYGPQTKEPHNRGSEKIIPGPMIVDIFPKSEKTKYHGDMTRTFIFGDFEGKERVEKMLEAVREVHDECVKMCTPERKVSEIHEHCIKRLEEFGFKTDSKEFREGMIHALGHGVGLEIHERPLISYSSDEVLKEGMVIAIEPGLYYDLGVRWENVVLIRSVGEEPKVLGLD